MVCAVGATTVTPASAQHPWGKLGHGRYSAAADAPTGEPDFVSDGAEGPLPISGAANVEQGGNTGTATVTATAVIVGGTIRSGTASGSVSGANVATGGDAGGFTEVRYTGINLGATPVSYEASASIDLASSGDAVAYGDIYINTPDSGNAYQYFRACTFPRSHWFFDLCEDLYEPGPAQGSIHRTGVVEPGGTVEVSVMISASARSFGRSGAEYLGSASGSFTASLRIGAPVGGHFDWSVPDRYGADEDEDGRIDSFEPDGRLDPSPNGFPVDFTDGSPEQCNTAVTRTWIIDGLEVAAGDPRIIRYDPNGCEFSYSFPAEGTYQVSLETTYGGSPVDLVTEDVLVQDWVIVSLGDSVASGEGNPEVPGILEPGWQNRQCHRSALAGPALAAQRLEYLDPKTSVTFVHLACSGATMDAGILGTYVGQEPGAPLPPQIVALQELVGDREIDAVTISVGANDVMFSDLVTTCFLHGDAPVTASCDRSGHLGSARDAFDARVPNLAPLYDELGTTLAASPLSIDRERVYVTEYFDPVRDEDGEFCDQKILEESANVNGLGISAAEAEWAGTEMLPTLNAEIQAAKARNGWNYVGGIFSRYGAHGYCSTSRWIVQITQSFRQQGNRDGTLHPNVPGHQLYGERIYEALARDLYLDGNLDLPRAPA